MCTSVRRSTRSFADASGFPQALYREAIGIARLKGLQEQVDSERVRLGKISEEVERSEETSRREAQVRCCH